MLGVSTSVLWPTSGAAWSQFASGGATELLVLALAMLSEPVNQLAWIKFGWVLLLGLAFLV